MEKIESGCSSLEATGIDLPKNGDDVAQMARMLAEFQHKIAKLENEKSELIERLIRSGMNPVAPLMMTTKGHKNPPAIHISQSQEISPSISPGDITDGTTDQEGDDDDYNGDSDAFSRSSSGPMRRRHSSGHVSPYNRPRSNSLTVFGTLQTKNHPCYPCSPPTQTRAAEEDPQDSVTKHELAS
jgi:hypothetical protein